MKTANTKKLTMTTLVLLLTLTGCNSSPLEGFVLEATTFQQQWSEMDAVENEPVPFTSALMSTTLNAQYNMLNSSETVNLILSIREQLIAMQISLNEFRDEIQTRLPLLRTNVETFKELGLSLTPEDQGKVDASRISTREARQAMRSTRGKVYEQLKTLRGQYQLENVATILAIYQDVEVQMILRVSSAETILNNLVLVNDLIAPYLTA